MRWIASAFALLLLGCSCAGPVPDEAADATPGEPVFESAGAVTIVYTNNVDGEIEPCG
jgi:hypothetical protein